jgi:hypothetical protein
MSLFTSTNGPALLMISNALVTGSQEDASLIPRKTCNGTDPLLCEHDAFLSRIFNLNLQVICSNRNAFSPHQTHKTKNQMPCTCFLIDTEEGTNQPTKKLTKGGVLRKRQTSSLARFNHSGVRDALLEMVKGALKL